MIILGSTSGSPGNLRELPNSPAQGSDVAKFIVGGRKVSSEVLKCRFEIHNEIYCECFSTEKMLLGGGRSISLPGLVAHDVEHAFLRRCHPEFQVDLISRALHHSPRHS